MEILHVGPPKNELTTKSCADGHDTCDIIIFVQFQRHKKRENMYRVIMFVGRRTQGEKEEKRRGMKKNRDHRRGYASGMRDM